jgi:hypothetical protein
MLGIETKRKKMMLMTMRKMMKMKHEKGVVKNSMHSVWRR